MIPLAFLAVAGGASLLVAGITASSWASVLKGHPDHANASPALGPAGETGPAGAPAINTTASTGKGSPGGLLGFATTQLGVPYAWGGELEKVEFDCSGLVQWAARKDGIHLPRTAQEQYAATQRLSPAEATAGDLVFFGAGREVTHVGIVVKPGLMLDAPHTGAKVRYENFPVQVGALWGSDHVIGYGRA